VRTPTLQRWWPTTQTLDLVEGSPEDVGNTVLAEVKRYVPTEMVTSGWESFETLDAAFREAGYFTNVPTFFLVLPTRSRWAVLWNNSYLCDGYDSLCSNLTVRHQLTTVHWGAHDHSTNSQPGAFFTHRKWVGSGVQERAVYVAENDGRWFFGQSGEPLAEEDLALYSARRKTDRLNERHVAELLKRLGADPWDEEFYAIQAHRSFVIRRREYSDTVHRKQTTEVLIKAPPNVARVG
jgi:hypothetical protein